MNLEAGELVELENHEKYLVMDNVKYNNLNYVFLITKQEPISIKIVTEQIVNDKVSLTVVENSKEIESLIKYVSR